MTNDTIVFNISSEKAGIRLDRVLTELEGIHSRSFAQKIIGESLVREKSGKVLASNYNVRLGDEIHVTLPAPAPIKANPEEIPVDIIFEDSDIIVVNKPRGMVVHPAPGNYGGTLVNALLYHSELSKTGGEIRPGIVHRLDKDTSGLMVVAKNDTSHVFLQNQLSERTMARVYQGVAHGWIKLDSQEISKPIGRHPKDRKKMAVVTTGKSREAKTHIKVLTRFVKKHKLTHFEASLYTGRTHQIRVHLASIGHSVLGDVLYGSEKQKLGGQILHAKELRFIHPTTKKEMIFDSKLPDYFIKCLE